jgi:serine/threonine protein kinase
MFQPGQLIANRYVVVERLGQGTMGVVYLVEHHVLGLRLALKLIHKKLLSDPSALQRFAREARAASHIEHPNVPYIFDHGETDEGQPYIAMELIEGQTLEDELASLRRNDELCELQRALHLLIQICEALQAAHEQQVLHRDLKPANVMLFETKSGAEAVKVVDFCLAGIQGIEQSTASLVLGTPQYLSPEQATGSSQDARSDLYCLGLIAFELLAGHPPYVGAALHVLRAHIDEAAPRLTAACARDVPPDLEALVASCLHKDPKYRPGSARKVKDRLEGLLRDEQLGRRRQLGNTGTQTQDEWLHHTLSMTERQTLTYVSLVDRGQATAIDELVERIICATSHPQRQPLADLYAAKVIAEDNLRELELELEQRAYQIALAERALAQRLASLHRALMQLENSEEPTEEAYTRLVERIRQTKEQHVLRVARFAEQLTAVKNDARAVVDRVTEAKQALLEMLSTHKTQLLMLDRDLLAAFVRAGI